MQRHTPPPPPRPSVYGKYSPNASSPSCASCPPGTTTSEEGGASSCLSCTTLYIKKQERLVPVYDSNDNPYTGVHADCALCTDEIKSCVGGRGRGGGGG